MDMIHWLMESQFLGKPSWMWVLFIGIVVTILVLDLGVLHRKQREIDVKESLILSAGYMALALLFGLYVWWLMGPTSAAQYYTGYIIEWSLSLDNVFVISLIFTYFAVPRVYQHRVLFYGILGVIVMRAVMIGLGAALVERFDWVMYIFGAFLLFTGVKMLMVADQKPDIESNPVLKIVRRFFKVTPQLHEEKFFVRQPDPVTGKVALVATPLFLCLVLVEFVDLVFAVDSVPAIFAITTDPFIVYTSNIFAILGLRALYFALAAMMHRFEYLKYALALVLVFIGGKIFWAQIYGKPDPAVSLGVTFAILAGGFVFSLLKTRGQSAQVGSAPTS